MARRFGGRYSPEQDAPAARQAALANAAVRRTRILFFVPFAFVLTAFRQPPLGMAVDLAAFGALMLAGWLTREGLVARMAYEARRVARRPAIPRILLGGLATATGLFLGGYAPGGSLLNPAIFAVLGLVLHALAFGRDPMRDKGIDGIDPFQQDRVAKVVAEGEKYLNAMSEAIGRTGDRTLIGRVARFQMAARDLFRTVEEDPGDLTAARRYMSVYLMGARDATVKFADFWMKTRDAKARADYEALLDDLETNFAARSRTLLLENRSGLDVEIEVLRDRLRRDGLTLTNGGE